MRPTWAEISLTTLRRNFRSVQQRVGDCTVCAVLKAHAYGHGAVECARALESEGAEWFGVTSTEEGLALRHGGIRTRILLMTGFWQDEEEEVIQHSLTPAVWQMWHVQALQRAAVRLGADAVAVHLKVDTGMARLGARVEELGCMLQAIAGAPSLRLEGVFTHLASAEVVDSTHTDEQLACFEQVQRKVRAAGITPRYFHAANTSAVAARPGAWMDMVRPGLALFGYQLDLVGDAPPGSAVRPLEVQAALAWKTRVSNLREVRAGQRVGYGGTYITPAPTRLAVVPIGYADGLTRKLSSAGRMVVRGQYAPVVGRVSMDLTTLDVTSIPGVQLGDEVVILGESQGCRVDAVEHARLAGTVPYEILCNIGKRVPRHYV